MQQVRDARRSAEDDAQIDESYIESHTSLVERRLRTLKSGRSFAVMDIGGDMGDVPESPDGLYHRDMRHLSRFSLSFTGQRPLLLSSVVHDDNAALSVDLTNPDIDENSHLEMPRDVIALQRTKFLWRDTAYERIGMRNYDVRRRQFRLDVHFDADFRDLFEVRGMRRARRGHTGAEVVAVDCVIFSHAGLDGIKRQTKLRFDPSPARLEADFASFDVVLAAGERRSILIDVQCIRTGDGAEATAPPEPFRRAYRNLRRSMRRNSSAICTIESSNDVFDEVIQRSAADIYMLVSETEHGRYPFAGIPWYSTAFGRDGLITAMLMLWADPEIVRGVLRYLAATQATHHDPSADAQPGKILHETRDGEMAMLGEVPFRRYYGTVDATPLFVMLAGQYFERTGDRETIARIWPHIEAALTWCEEYGDRDGDGFVEYHRETEAGLANQGWKDSHDSMFHADGACAEGPIALVEVQGYVYAAKTSAAGMARALDKPEMAERLQAEAVRLREAFDAAFWCEEIDTYAMALDGEKRPLAVRSSNAGHALFSGIAKPERAVAVARTLMHANSFSGWGIRTIARGEARYNPMSYHNGSVWPHDNALIAIGFGRYGLAAEAARVFSAMFDAASYQELRRLPELFCGFLRRPRRGPTAYPVACSPQAWAAAVPFGLLQASLGLELPFADKEVRFQDPLLPDFLSRLRLRGLQLGAARLDLSLDRHDGDMTVSVLSREGDVRVMLVK